MTLPGLVSFVPAHIHNHFSDSNMSNRNMKSSVGLIWSFLFLCLFRDLVCWWVQIKKPDTFFRCPLKQGESQLLYVAAIPDVMHIVNAKGH